MSQEHKISFNPVHVIDDLNAKAELQWTPSEAHQVKIGGEATQHRFLNFLYGGPFGAFPTQAPASEGEPASALEASLFAQDEWSITPDLIVNAGVRGTYFSNGQHLRVEPRLSAVYKLSPDVSLKAGYGITHQFVQMVAQGGVSVPTETWFPASASIEPSRSTHVTAGAEAYLFDREVLVTGEVYYKTMENLYEFREDAEFRSGAPLARQITRGRGTAYGFELFVNKQLGRWTGWIGYTLSWTDRQFDELNRGRPFFARFDRRREVQVTSSYKLDDAWELGAVFVFGSG
jgi:outer membrane receptor protein involved in Fe transport